MNGNNVDITELVADEIASYLYHLEIISKIKNETKGTVTEFSALSFGTPSSASFEITDDGIINVDFDFSSTAWDYDDDNKITEDVNLDVESLNMPDTWKWMRGKQQSRFDYKFKKGMFDTEALKAVLLQKYGINCNISYDEKVYSETRANGSDGMESEDRFVYFVVDSHMNVKGNTRYLNQDQVAIL